MVWIVNQPSATVASDSARSRALGALAGGPFELTRMNSDATAAIDRAEGDDEDDPGRFVGASGVGLEVGRRQARNADGGVDEIEQEEGDGGSDQGDLRFDPRKNCISEEAADEGQKERQVAMQRVF